MPLDNTVNPGTKHPILAPGPIEASELCLTKPSGVRWLSANHFPVDPGVVLEATPDVASSRLRRPRLVVEATNVPGNPNFPHSKSTEEGPNGSEFTESSWKALGEDAMMPVDFKMNRRIGRRALHVVDEGGAPDPDPASLDTIPKTMKNRLRDAWAEGA